MPQPKESPPSKPPRRRYSDQVSMSSLGTISANKRQDDNSSKSILKVKTSFPKATYHSLPVSLVPNSLTKCHISTTGHNFAYETDRAIFSQTDCPDNSTCTIHESYVKKPILNFGSKCRTLKKFSADSQDTNLNHIYLNYKSEKLGYCLGRRTIIDNTNINNASSNNVCIELSQVKCHRRHLSDSIISYFHVSNESASQKFDFQNHYDVYVTSKQRKCESCTTASKHNYLILQEIKSLKEINEKLWQHLCSVQSCLEKLKRKGCEKSAEFPISSLLSGIYYAQKAKDIAMEERVKLAFEERNAAFQELEQTIDILLESPSSSSSLKCTEDILDEEFVKLLNEVVSALNTSQHLKGQRKLLSYLCNRDSSKKYGLPFMLKCALIDRNAAIEKTKKLEEEVKKIQKCFNIWHIDNQHWEHTLIELLHQLLYKRNDVPLKIDHNDYIVKSSFIKKLQLSLKHTNTQIKTTERSASNDSSVLVPHTSGKYEEVKEDVKYLIMALDDERNKREQAERQCLRLERLIHTLRIKTNGQNIGVPV